MAQTENLNSATTTPDRGQSLARVKRLLGRAVILMALIYAAILGYMYFNQQALLYKAGDVLPDPASVGLADVEVDRVAMSDGTELTVWSAPASLDGAPTVLFFHGQSGSLGDRADRMNEILNSGYGLVAPSYRGFPGSDGAPSEPALISDAVQLYDRLAAQGASVVLHGQSLGTGIAAAVAAERPDATLLVLEAPFTATVDVAGERYPLLPVSLLMKDQFATRDIIGDITVPTLIFHGELDETVPVHHGKALADLSNGNAELFLAPDGHHNDLWSFGLWDQVQARLTTP